MSIAKVNFPPSEVTSKETQIWNDGYSAGYSDCENDGKGVILDLLNLGAVERQKMFHTASIISISPHLGHDNPVLFPIIQKAGHTPLRIPPSIFILASYLPYLP